MKSTRNPRLKPPFARVLLLWLLAVASCGESTNPILPSPRGGSGSLVIAEGSDGGLAIDAVSARDSKDVATDADASEIACDLVTYILTKKGCPSSSQACYPVNGAGQCQEVGYLTTNVFCSANEGIEGRCAAGLACVNTAVLGYVCEPLCDTLNPPGDCPSCKTFLSDSTVIGYCLPY